MTNEELIEYANKHYVVGVKFLSIFSDGGVEREIDLYEDNSYISWRWNKDVPGITAYNGIKREYGSNLAASVVIYKDGQWAPIINKEYQIF